MADGLKAGLRRLLPRSLLARSVLIILAPMLVLQGVALQLFYGGHLDVISRRLAGGVAGDVAFIAELVRREPPEAHPWIFREAAWRLELGLAFEPGGSIQGERRPSMSILPLEEDLNTALAERVRARFDTDWQSDPRSIIIRVQLPDGVLHVEAPRKRLFTATLYLFVIWLVGSALLLSGVAVLFMKNQVRAIRRLAAAAEAFGLGRDLGAIKPEGASEVRQAAAAFNRMRERIRRFVSQRTDMLAGISHDLRTPLTRMRLAITMLPRAPETEEDIAALTQDMEEMERMIAAYLSFARGEGTEQARPADLVALVQDVAAKARRSGAAVEVAAPATLALPLRPDAVSRCLGNIIDNARRHAQRIAVAVDTVPRHGLAGPGGEGRIGENGAGESGVGENGGGTGGSLWAQVTVDDDGPGIPANEREDAFRPFSSGSPDGTGLGLAIARDIVRAHGGDIVLEESPLGGLRARLRLPV